MRIAALFFWLALPIAGWLTYTVFGLPHAIWTYTFYNNGAPHNPLAKREYIDCTFWGPYGRFTVPADAGYCGWVKFFKPSSSQ